MTRVTALIPTYNRADLLPEAIAAIRAQSRPVDEILVVDDGSTDATASVIAGMAGVRCLRQANSGKSAALNAGLRECRGDYIWICDDDDLAAPTAVERLLDAIRGEGADYAFGTYLRLAVDPDTGARRTLPAGYWPELDGRSLFTALMEDFFMFQNATLVARRVYDTVGPFRTDLLRSQDYEMALRIARSFRGAYVPDVIFHQRQHGGARGSAADRFTADRQEEKWGDYDKRIFLELRQSLPLAEFGRELADLPPETARRGALLQRACICARRNLWDLALQDLAAAAAIAGPGRLTPQERRICGRFLLSKYGSEGLLAHEEIGAELARIAATGPLGREMVAEISRPLVFRAREALTRGRLRVGAAFLGLMREVHGAVGASRLVYASARAKLGRPSPA